MFAYLVDGQPHTSMNRNVSQREFYELADLAFTPLRDNGFRHDTPSDFAYTLTSNVVAIRVTSGDRIGNVETEISHLGNELNTSVFRLAAYLNARDHPAYKFSRFDNGESARRSLESHVDFLTEYCTDWLTGSLVAFQQIREFEDVDNGLYTQQFTCDARPSDQWDLVKSAWDRQRWSVFVKLIRRFSPPFTEYERRAIAYAETRRTMR